MRLARRTPRMALLAHLTWTSGPDSVGFRIEGRLVVPATIEEAWRVPRRIGAPINETP